ncbi:MAG TPA: tetratricopeptide repeat protein [Thermoanaerobaculia bacterium]|nr:tetratricopeptide repeat protein [Thermoanaerobaculia bacterium]
MPATINGIGTHYYGAKNRSAHIGTCKSCGRSATLSSYDTREWFCVVFIPLIPIRKYRILNACSRCRKHFRIAADEFAQKLAAATEPIRSAIRSAPRDVAPRIQLVQTLIAWEMRDEADKELQSALAAFPQNTDLMVFGGQLAVDKNDFARATAIYEQAYRQDPQNGAASYGYGWVLQQTQKSIEAIPVLQKAASQDFNKFGALYLLGKCHMNLSHWSDALNAFQQLLGANPAYQKDKQLLRMIADCKRQIGYELTPAERSARRRWWPFARTGKRAATLQGPPTLVRPSLRYAGIAIAVIAVAGLAFYAWDRWTNIDVYFDNGLDRSVKVQVDNDTFDLALNSLHEQQLTQGSHTAVVRATDGKEVERLTFSLQRLNPISALFTDRFFVYNIGLRHIYRRGSHTYAQRAEDAANSAELIGMKRFFEQRDVDFPFMPPPETIEADSTSHSVHKVSFDVARDLDLRKFALIRLQQGRKKEAAEALVQAVENSPCDTATRRTQIYFASLNSPEEASDTARRWVTDCAQDDLEAHRAYQDVNRESGREDKLREEYGTMLAAAPQSGKAHYLFGRVAGETQRSIAEYQQAVALDPSLVWPHVALGRAYQNVDRFDDALRELATALDMKGCDPSVVVYFATAAIAKGLPAEVTDRTAAFAKAHPHDVSALHAQWLLALDAKDWETAMRLEKALTPLEAPQTAWWRTTKRMCLTGDTAVDGRIDSARLDRNLQPIAIEFEIERLIQAGEYEKAAEAIDTNAKILEPAVAATLDAYAAGGFLFQNESAKAEKLLIAAEAMTAGEGVAERRITVALIKGLRGSTPADSVLELMRVSDETAHGWFVEAVRAAQSGDRKRAAESLDHCARTASTLDFPYLEAKAMEARLR